MDQATPLSSDQDRKQSPQQPLIPPPQTIPPHKLVVTPTPQIPTQPVPPAPKAMNRSYHKPEFSGEPDEDLEAHLLRTINWMDTHNFPADQGVRRFPPNLAGEARLWYQSKHQFQGNLGELQERFRTQFSKIGNTRKQLFHA